MSSTPSSQARGLGNRSANFVRRITQTPQRLDTNGLSRTDKLKLANKLSNDNIDLIMLLYAYFIFLVVIIVIVFLYRYKQEVPHRFSGDIGDSSSLWMRFVNWLFLQPNSGIHPACDKGRPAITPTSVPTCEEANRIFTNGSGTKGNGMC
jgi:hypothetical protein